MDKQLVKERELKNQLMLHSGSRCELPGCNNQATDKHEIIERSQCGDPTNPFNCVLLCRLHHQIQTDRLVGYINDEAFLKWLILRRIKQGFRPEDYGCGGGSDNLMREHDSIGG